MAAAAAEFDPNGSMRGKKEQREESMKRLLEVNTHQFEFGAKINDFFFFFSVEAADASVAADAEEFPERVAHADADQLGLARALARQRRGGQRRPAVQTKGERVFSSEMSRITKSNLAESAEYGKWIKLC